MKEKTTNVVNVPNLRFPGFEGEWERKMFDDLFDFSTGRNIKQNEASPNFTIKCVRYGELYHMYGEIISEVVNRTNLDKSQLLFSKGNEILLPSAGEDPLDIGSASALTIPNVAIGRTINILRPKESFQLSQIFVSFYINQKLRKKISSLAKGVSISNVYNSDLRKLHLNLPIFNEQQKITSFLVKINERISTQIEIIEHQESLKKGLMQQLFSQQLRFKDNNGADFPGWEEKKLGEVCKVITGKTPKTNDASLWNGTIKFITPTDIIEDEKYQKRTTRTVVSTPKLKILPIGSIIYTCIASIGKMAITTELSITNQQINSLIPNKVLNDEIIYYSLLYLTPKIKSTQANTTLPIINKSEFSNLKFLIPSSKKEQTKIANFLSSIDERLEKEKQLLETYKQQKKYLLQNMFV